MTYTAYAELAKGAAYNFCSAYIDKEEETCFNAILEDGNAVFLSQQEFEQEIKKYDYYNCLLATAFFDPNKQIMADARLYENLIEDAYTCFREWLADTLTRRAAAFQAP